jgi:hypothetical protein
VPSASVGDSNRRAWELGITGDQPGAFSIGAATNLHQLWRPRHEYVWHLSMSQHSKSPSLDGYSNKHVNWWPASQYLQQGMSHR